MDVCRTLSGRNYSIHPCFLLFSSNHLFSLSPFSVFPGLSRCLYLNNAHTFIPHPKPFFGPLKTQGACKCIRADEFRGPSKGSGRSYGSLTVIYGRIAGHLWGQREVTVGESFDHHERSQFSPVRRKNCRLMDGSDGGERGRKDVRQRSIILNEQWII